MLSERHSWSDGAPTTIGAVLGPAAAIELREMPQSAIAPKEWDAFAARCDVAARGLFDIIRLWPLKHWGWKLRFFEVYAGPKVAQCAIAWRDGECRFLPRLQLDPTLDVLWRPIMTEILRRLGPCTVRYGWHMSLEPPREGQLAERPGVDIGWVRPIVTQAVEFSKWPSWDAYYSAISENSRRNAKAAVKKMPDLHMNLGQGMKSLSNVPALSRFRGQQAKTKGLDIDGGRIALSCLTWAVTCPSVAFSAGAISEGHTLSACFGWRIGPNFWYNQAGSATDNKGAAWFMLIELLRHFYEAAPTGKFIMGFIDYDTHDEAQSGGLLRSRASVRVSDLPTSVVEFTYREVS